MGRDGSSSERHENYKNYRYSLVKKLVLRLVLVKLLLSILVKILSGRLYSAEERGRI